MSFWALMPGPVPSRCAPLTPRARCSRKCSALYPSSRPTRFGSKSIWSATGSSCSRHCRKSQPRWARWCLWACPPPAPPPFFWTPNANRCATPWFTWTAARTTSCAPSRVMTPPAFKAAAATVPAPPRAGRPTCCGCKKTNLRPGKTSAASACSTATSPCA